MTNQQWNAKTEIWTEMQRLRNIANHWRTTPEQHAILNVAIAALAKAYWAE